MNAAYLEWNDGISSCSPGRSAKELPPAALPAGDLLEVPAGPFAELAKPAKTVAEPGPAIPPPAAPTSPGKMIPFPTPSAEVWPAATESSLLLARPFSVFGSLTQFEDAQRMATLLAHSSIVPENYRGEAHVGDCLIVLEIANRIGASILAVMQNLQTIHGRPAWSSQFLISCVNASKRFSSLRYQMTGTCGTDNRGCLAWAFDPSGERLESPEVTLKMAKQEGWYYRLGSKWRTMPELMLRYRSATLFARLYAPEIAMGIQTTEEVAELSVEGNGPPSRPAFESELPKPEFEPKPDSKIEPEMKATNAFPSLPASGKRKRRTTPGPEPAAKQESPCPRTPGPAPHSAAGHYHYLKALNGLIGLSPHSETEVLNFLRHAHRCNESLDSLAEVAAQQPDVIVWAHDHWNVVEQELSQLRKGPTP